jgi:hypothetical protein
VVERLSGIVEQALVVLERLPQDGYYVCALHLRALDHIISSGDVLGVVLVVVESQSSFADVGL